MAVAEKKEAFVIAERKELRAERRLDMAKKKLSRRTVSTKSTISFENPEFPDFVTSVETDFGPLCAGQKGSLRASPCCS